MAMLHPAAINHPLNWLQLEAGEPPLPYKGGSLEQGTGVLKGLVLLLWLCLFYAYAQVTFCCFREWLNFNSRGRFLTTVGKLL